ncbi:hypothetical protein QJS10_CPB04g01953 [Acorus calamus]|uniref:Uncharacterized protein n=1 Tax=Acorus calamus TaxID=4465 RepID=A0AAV9F021_ACOCL|nr:hypothetical protein QJS10_CPB04g01953 [Acorus calamus]
MELEKAAKVFWNAKDRLPPRTIKIDMNIETDLAYALTVRECPQLLFLRGNRMVYREKAQIQSFESSLWTESSEVIRTGLPVLLAKDFNTLLDSGDKWGGLPFRVSSAVQDFRNWVHGGELQPLGNQGPSFSWCSNRIQPNWIWELFDRAFTSASWLEIFPDIVVSILPRTCSDHAPLLIDSSPPTPQGSKPFRFE